MKFFDLPGNPPPDNATSVSVTTADGLGLRGFLAVPASATEAEAKGTIVIIGGRADFIERYFETARDLQALGLAVAILDLRGQGGSQRLLRHPSRGYVASFKDYVTDLNSFMTQSVMPSCPAPYYLLAHSTGGNVALQFMARYDLFEKYIITAPLLGLRFGTIANTAAWVLAEFATPLLGKLPLPYRSRSKNVHFQGNSFTHDQFRWQRDNFLIAQAPELSSSTATFAWLRSALRSFPYLRRIAKRGRLKRPILAILAGQEKIVDNEAAHRLARKGAPMAIITIPGAGHEIMFETDEIRAQFLAALDAFLVKNEKQ